MEQIPHVIEMRSGSLVEWLMPDRDGRFKWTLDHAKASRFASLAHAWQMIEWAGHGGKDNVRPVQVKR